MGLDFGIERVVSGSNVTEEVAYGRNCWHVRSLIINRLKEYDTVTQTAKLTLCDLNSILKILMDDVKFFDDAEVEPDDYRVQVYDFISDVAKAIAEAYMHKYEYGVDYEYILYDSY